MRYKRGYRVLDFNPKIKQYKTLFHAVNGSRVLPTGKFIKAKRTMVSDGDSTKYLSGFHVFEHYRDCYKYAARFGKRNQRVIVMVEYTGNRRKKHSLSNVILADSMRLPEDDWVTLTLADLDKLQLLT